MQIKAIEIPNHSILPQPDLQLHVQYHGVAYKRRRRKLTEIAKETKMPEAFIQIDQLYKTFDTPAGPLNVLRGIDLDIHKGDFVALIGPSGSGKTTFLNMLTAVDAPTSGDVTVGDVQVTQVPQRRLTKWRARNVGIVFQFFQLLPTLTVVENVIAPMDFANVWKPGERHDIAMKLLERFEIADQAFKTPDMLSGGQQQRVAIARALANNPPLVIGDEPTGNLDRMSADNVFNLFQQLADRGTTVIIVTHDRELVRNVPKLYELADGTIGETTLEAAARRRTAELRATRTKRATKG
jgi:putative ABC transport system ATP-binding protein